MTRILKALGWFVLLFMIMPCCIGGAIAYHRGWPPNWKAASWASSGLLPQANLQKPATVIVLASRTGRWKGIFADHMSIVLKPEGAMQWTRYDVVGWGNPVRKNDYVADALWYGNVPRILYEVQGEKAAALIPKIEAAIAAYPYQQKGSYVIWPGPNSNSFVSWVVRHTDGFEAELSAVAVGKDYLGPGLQTARAPSGTGYTVSLAGYVGGTLAWDEGFELHLIGSTIGICPKDLAIKLPSLGKLSLKDLWS